MSFPRAFLDDLAARVPVSDVVGRRVSWDRRKTNPGKGDWWACCPFHQESTPSFHVDDRRGFYKCFGCGASGDGLKFLTEHDQMEFAEAVEELARMAGVEVPRRDPKAAERAERAKGLADWMEAAVRHFRARLAAPEGREARAYLARRGLSAATVERFELGYAPPGRTLNEALSALGATRAALVEAGLIGVPEDGGAPYDFFRDRLMFPVRDGRGRCVAFGGRALAADAKAKYVNSRETPLFDKSRTLYNVGPARTAAQKAGELIVAEGYMDVIALAQAGFENAVAPLGTALTAPQLEMLWRSADEPVIALDGDAAGLAAAGRAIDAALPLLKPGKTLRFAALPDGRDPDELIRAAGAGAMRAALDAAEPMIDALWRREAEARPLDNPERRAGFDARLRDLLERIADRGVRTHYRAAFAERRAALFAPARPQRAWRDGPRRDARAAPLPSTRASARAMPEGAPGAARLSEAALLRLCLACPPLARARHDALTQIAFLNDDLERDRRQLVAALFELEEDAALADRLSAMLDGEIGRRCAVFHAPRAAAGGAPSAQALAMFDEVAARLGAASYIEEIEDAVAALCAPEAPPGVDDRLSGAVAAARRDLQGSLSDDSDGPDLSRALRDATSVSERLIAERKRRRGGPNH